MKITEGICFYKQVKPRTFEIGFFADHRDRIIEVRSDDCDSNKCTIEEAEANSWLIAEAFNVANDTGYTPRQLAEQKAELLFELKSNVSEFERLLKDIPNDLKGMVKGIIETNKQPIKNATS